MVLNMCESIGARVPVDLSVLVALRIVAYAVAGGERACQNFEIGYAIMVPWRCHRTVSVSILTRFIKYL